MADQANAYVKNVFAEDIQVFRQLADGTTDLSVTIGSGMEDMVYLGGTDVALLVNAPEGVNTEGCFFSMRPDLELAVSCYRTNAQWRVKLAPNEAPPNNPTTLNITVGVDEP